MTQRGTSYHGTTITATPYGLALHHVQLAIPPHSEELCRAFYLDVLGMTEIPKPPALAERGGLWLRADDLVFHLGIDEDFHPARKAHPGILVADLDSLANQLTKKGTPVTWSDDLPGYRRLHAFDVVGNRLEFLAEIPG